MKKRMDDLEKLVETMKLAMDIKDEEAASAQAEAKAAKEEVVRLRQDTSGTASHQETESPMPRTVYITPGRKLERFSGRPEKSSDPSGEDCIEDVHVGDGIKEPTGRGAGSFSPGTLGWKGPQRDPWKRG